jgi:hypothetical protein
MWLRALHHQIRLKQHLETFTNTPELAHPLLFIVFTRFDINGRLLFLFEPKLHLNSLARSVTFLMLGWVSTGVNNGFSLFLILLKQDVLLEMFVQVQAL